MSDYTSNTLTGEGIWIALGQAAVLLGAFALLRVLTLYLTPGQFGELALALTISVFVNQVVSGGFDCRLCQILSRGC